MRGQRRVVWWMGMGVLGLGVAYGVWRAATQPQALSGSHNGLRTLALGALCATPSRDQVADLAQMTLGYDLLRFAAYTTIAFCKVLLPALAAGTIAGDRQAGRLQDLRMLPIRSATFFLAKIAAAALPFLALSLLLLLLFAGVAYLEFVPLSEVGRLAQETVGQILLTACVVVTCSAFCATTMTARMAAHILLWGMLPVGWLCVLLWASAVPSLHLGAMQFLNHQEKTEASPMDFTQLCLLQALLTFGISFVLSFLGILRLRTEDRSGKGKRATD